MPALATYEQAVSPENVAKVSLTGLSFVLAGVVLFQEPINVIKLLSVCLIVCGIAGLKLAA